MRWSWGGHVRNALAAFVDGALEQAEARRVQAHLNTCATCRTALERHMSVSAVLREVVTVSPPDRVWSALVETLDEAPFRHQRRGANVNVAVWHRWAAALAVVAFALGVGWWLTRPEVWDVMRLDRSFAGRVDAGEWLHTAAGETAAIRIGTIGRVDLSERTRLQLVAARPNEHRLHLAVGRISVEIIAPPRVFFVNTPASTVVDLGCAYTMEVDAAGGGRLQVTQGWAALEHQGRESLVPAGASARTHPERGPGTPAFDDATAAFLTAVDAFDEPSTRGTALSTMLAEARPRDTLTLWHVMSRVDESERARVFNRMIALTPLPDGVTREGALALDGDTMRRWREELAWTW